MTESQPQDDVIAAIERHIGARHSAGPVRRIDTHGAVILLGETHAFKLKRAVNLGYLDFSTVARRHAACRAELALNRRTAPDLYLGLRPVIRGADGGLILGELDPDKLDQGGADDRDALDWVIEMRRFADDALLAGIADRGELTQGLLRDLADAVARFHDRAAIVEGHDGVERVHRVIEGNRAAMAALPPGMLDADDGAELVRRWQGLLDAHAPMLARRAAQGHVRLCHGDLHLANICLWQGQPTLFDCLEFDPDLATTDVLYDLAFLIMDLCARGLGAAANRVFNRYCDRRPHEQEGLGAMGLFLSLRAGIRAHVGALGAVRQADPARAIAAARHYLTLALDVAAPHEAPARLSAIGGLSGTGKSTLAGALAPLVAPAPGARWLRSDVIRKRLAGVEPEVRLPPESYTQAASERVYAAMLAEATDDLAMGRSVVIDAVSGSARDREGLARAAAEAGAGFVGLWLEADDATMIARATERSAAPGGDASDADASVVRNQIAHRPAPPVGWVKIDADKAPDAVLAEALAACAIEA